MPINMDFTNIETAGGDFEPIPAGAYKATVFNVEETTFKTGAKGYSVTFKVQDGEHAGRRLWTNYVTHTADGAMNTTGLAFLKGFLVAIGFTDEQLNSAQPILETDMMGRACVVQVSVGHYQGKANNSVEQVLPSNADITKAAAAATAAPATASTSSW